MFMKTRLQHQAVKIIIALIFGFNISSIYAESFADACPKTSYLEKKTVTLIDGSEINCFYTSQGKLASAQTKPCYFLKSCFIYEFHPSGEIYKYTIHFPKGYYERRYDTQGMLIGKTKFSLEGKGEECRYVGNYQLKCEHYDSDNDNLIYDDYIGVEYLNY